MMINFICYEVAGEGLKEGGKILLEIGGKRGPCYRVEESWQSCLQ